LCEENQVYSRYLRHLIKGYLLKDQESLQFKLLVQEVSELSVDPSRAFEFEKALTAADLEETARVLQLDQFQRLVIYLSLTNTQRANFEGES
jgi:hypothetical protein